MIEPNSNDIGRKVTYLASGDLVHGKVTDFNAAYVYIDVGGTSIPMRRDVVDWADAPIKVSPHMESAMGTITTAGIACKPLDEHQLQVAGDLVLWPAVGAWKGPDGKVRGGGVGAVMKEVRGRAGVEHARA